MSVAYTVPDLPAWSAVSSDIRALYSEGRLTNGATVREFERQVADFLGVRNAIAVNSGTTGLMLLLSTLPPRTRVIFPSFTFSATYEAIVWNNHIPVPVECDLDGMIDVKAAADAISSKGTIAVLAVHMFGRPCDIDALTDILAGRKDTFLFFDSAHAFGSSYRLQMVGGFGTAEVFSFGPTKVLPIGEGGMVTTNDDYIARQVRFAVLHGQDVPGSVNACFHGMNGRMQEMNAVIGLAQLQRLHRMLQIRAANANFYRNRLGDVPGIRFQTSDGPIAISAHKDFPIFIDASVFGMSAGELRAELRKQDIETKQYFNPPVHQLADFRKREQPVRLPATERLAESVLCLPMASVPGWTEKQATVVTQIRRLHEDRRSRTFCKNRDAHTDILV